VSVDTGAFELGVRSTWTREDAVVSGIERTQRSESTCAEPPASEPADQTGSDRMITDPIVEALDAPIDPSTPLVSASAMAGTELKTVYHVDHLLLICTNMVVSEARYFTLDYQTLLLLYLNCECHETVVFVERSHENRVDFRENLRIEQRKLDELSLLILGGKRINYRTSRYLQSNE
jgi:hypothetical protein